jgi:hypothetical protein
VKGQTVAQMQQVPWSPSNNNENTTTTTTISKYLNFQPN